MFKILGFILLIHAAISLIRYRKHVVFTGHEYTIPIDILVEVLVGFALNMIFGIILDKQFLDIHVFPSTKTYDQTFQRQNFKVPGGRGAVLVKALQKKIGNFDFSR